MGKRPKLNLDGNVLQQFMDVLEDLREKVSQLTNEVTKYMEKHQNLEKDVNNMYSNCRESRGKINKRIERALSRIRAVENKMSAETEKNRHQEGHIGEVKELIRRYMVGLIVTMIVLVIGGVVGIIFGG